MGNKSIVENLDFAFYEVAMLGFLVLFIINVFYGVNKNNTFAKTWYESNAPFIKDNYSHSGITTGDSAGTETQML
jgi:hypothetical protein